MNTVKFNKGKVQVVAHRGLSGIERENTNAAFVAAANRSYFGIETDIHRTADGRFIVLHDNDFLRVSGEQLAVEEVDLATAQGIVLYDMDGTHNRRDLISPTLENYINICKKYEKHAVLELKSDFTEAEIGAIINIIDGFDYLGSTTFISFVFDNLVKIRAKLPEQSVQSLFGNMIPENYERAIAHKMDVDVAYKALTADKVKMFHDAGLKVNCWTVDNKEAAEALAEMGVDMITTNILE